MTTQSILSSDDYIVLGEVCQSQDETNADYKAYCSDGMIRYYSVSAYSCDPRDGSSYSGYSEEIPTWKTKKGNSLLPIQMSPSHRFNALMLCKKKLASTKDEIEKASLICSIKALQNPKLSNTHSAFKVLNTKTNPLYSGICRHDTKFVSLFATNLTNDLGEPYCVASSLSPQEAREYQKKWNNREDALICCLPLSHVIEP